MMRDINTSPTPVKLFTGMLAREDSLFTEIEKKMKDLFGPIDIKSESHLWKRTSYYEKEMGPDLKRKFLFFEKLICPGEIADIKLQTVEIEKQYLNEKGGRKINIDPGYLDAAKLVLASTKNFSHRIYLDKGIYAEATLIYSGNDYLILPYTYPDFRRTEYLDLFKKVRELFKRPVSR